MNKLTYLLKCSALLLPCLIGQKAMAQQDPVFTQYMYNKALINPAFVGSYQTNRGSEQNWYFGAMHRRQWQNLPTDYTGTGVQYPSSSNLASQSKEASFSGYNQAPLVSAFNFHKAFGRKSIADPNPLGGGMAVIQETVGLEKRLTVQASLAYHIQFSSEALWKKGNRHLFFGVNAGMKQFGLNRTWLDPHDTGDQLLSSANSSAIAPDLGAGILFKNDAYFFSVSIPHLLENTINYSSYTFGGIQSSMSRHYYFMGGMYIPIKKDNEPKMHVAPSTLVRYVPGAPVQFDFNVRLVSLANEAWWVGFGYRSNDAATAMAGLNIGQLGNGRENKKILLGYSYDFTMSSVNATSISNISNQAYNNGTHEIMLIFDVNTEKARNTKYDGGRNGLR